MQSLIVPVMLLGLAQQAPVLEPPRYIPPPPKPAVVKPVPARTPIVQSLLLIPPAPVPQLSQPQPTLPQPIDTTLRQPHPVHHSAARQIKRIDKGTWADLKNENRRGVTSFLHHAKHVPVKEFARSLSRKFAMDPVIDLSYQKNKAKPFLVIIPEENTGSLIITTNTRNVDEIK